MHRTVLAAALLGFGVFGFTASASAFQENFDAVTAPALPAGWTAAKTGTNAVNWATSTTTPNSAPNAVFAPDPAGIACAQSPPQPPPESTNDEVLTSPAIAVGAQPKIVFQNNYATENTFDGGVLEVSVDGGPFKDILDAGGVFDEHPYNGTISNSFGSPIAGRQAWTGISGAYVRTTARLPTVTEPATLQLRFRMVTDCSVGLTGWWIDDLVVSSAPIATTDPASSLLTDAAVLHGTLSTDATASYHFEYGKTTGYGSVTPDRVALDAAGQAAIEQLAGLDPDTTYHYRLVASNPLGTGTGEDQTFTTSALPAPEPPPATTVPAPPADTTAPETTIDKAKVKDTKGKAKFRFSSSEEGSHFECRLDKGEFAACTSPQGYKHLKDGKHKFYVRAIDAANNVDATPAKTKFKIKEKARG